MYTLHRTYVMTNTATGTLVVINDGKIIFNLDSTVRAGLFTLATADT